MSKFSHDDDDAAADDARAMTIPRRFFSKTAELKIKKLTKLSPRSYPRHLIGNRTTQRHH